MRYFILVSVALAFGCSNDSPSTPSDPMAALVGSWSIQSWDFRDASNPTRRVDRVAAGFGGTLTVETTGAFTVSLTFLGQAFEPQTGTLTIHGDTLGFHTADGDALIRFTTSRSTMTWDTLEPEVFDMDGDEVLDSVVEHMVFRRG
jgi:hypothetical protein